MADPSDVERDLQTLAVEMRRLESEYNMYFAGRVPRPPWESRTRFEALFKRADRGHVEKAGARFRLQQLQARYATLVELWDRGVRAREEGRSGPFGIRAAARPGDAARQGRDDTPERVVHVASFVDPLAEREKLEDLYTSLADARRETGEAPVPFHRFAEFVRDEMLRLREQGMEEVALRVAVKDGHVHLTARGPKDRP